MSKVVLIKSDKLGEDGLGAMVMGGFLQAIGMQENVLLPKCIILLNRGVLLGAKNTMIDNQNSLEALQKLESLGVMICSCQTCVEHFGLQDKVEVGKVENALSITKILLENEVLSL